MALALNKRAKHEYELLETYEGGLKLTGSEAKSAKAGHAQLVGSFLHVRGGELWLKNAFIAPYAPAAGRNHEPNRDRKVLVKKSELKKIAGKTQAQGLTLVPISLYVARNLVKLEFAIARGKKEYEKRETIKKRDVQKQLRERMRT